ncbi:MAG: T9SS type A sorting domain-containing protein, partial [Bacteroidales bacterium]|nr:T9SS type A sorting domain-containing protein [Bacteroidales bacterium]
IDVSKRTRIFTDDSFSQVINLGDNLDRIRMEDTGGEYYITVESLDGTETYTAEELGLRIDNIDGIDFLSGTPQMPGEYIYHITIPENGACPAIVYDNFLGIYDTEELAATALDATLCEGETATLATVERPGAYGGEYVWTLEEDTVGTGSRINVIPPVGTSTYEVACGGKRMYGEYEIGDYLIPGEAFGETGYSMLKNTEITMYDYQTGYMITNVEQDSLLLMSLSKIEEVEWSQAPEMLAADDEDMYLPSADELGYILSNYDKFYFALEYDLPVMLSSTEKDANTVYVLNVNYARMMEYPKAELATAMGFKKIAKSEVINMVGRTSNISRTASVNVTVSERQDMAISTDDVLCNTDTARVGINTGYEVVNWYNVTHPETEIVFDEDIAVLPEGTYIAVGTYELGSCYDTLEVKVKDLAFYVPQDTTVCDSAIITIAKEDVIVMVDNEAIEGQTLVITETGTYTISLVGVGDTCREERTLNLIVNQSYRISFDTIVYDSTFVWNNETYTATGNYTQFFTTINGCDSIVTANVTFVNSETEFALFGIVTESDGTTPLAEVEVSSDGASVTTSNDGRYLIMIQRTSPVVHFSKAGYNIICDSVMGGGEYNVVMYKPEINVSMSDDSYETNPYVMRQVVVELSNSGDGPLAWSSVVESDFMATDRAVHPRSNSQMWDYADDVIVTNSNAEQAIATDGFYIYTASWRRAGEFNRYSPHNGYLETFVIDGVGGVRNLSYGNGFFFATDNTNKIYKINMDTQTLEDVITLNDPDLQIRYCTYSTEEDLLYIGNWTNLYKLVAYNTAYPTLIPLSYSMNNVYSIAYDAFSGAEPCLWAFSQISENNGPFAKIYKLNKNGVQIAEMEHFINDASLATSSSLAGGICVSQYLYDDKYVLLANIQNSNTPNNIAVYEIGAKSSWVKSDIKGGIIPAGGSINVTVTEMATQNGEYSAVVKFKPNVYMPENTNLNLSLSVSSPACSPVENLVTETDTFHVVNLSWEAVDAGDYESVSYLIYEQGSDVALDTVQTTSYSVENPEVGEHCYYVRTLMHGEADCVSNPSNTACAEILAFPCDVQLTLAARAYGDRIRLEWNELFGVEHYEVHVDDLSGVILYNGSETMFEDTIASLETDYCYKVVAYFRNDECEPNTSNSACARISAGGCSELPVVTATAVGNSVALSWGNIQGIQSYSLYRDGKYVTSTSDTAYYDMMLDYETEYCYVVEINCGYGMFGLSDEVCVTTEKEYEEQNAIDLITDESIDLYPNPASDRFFIEGQQMRGVQIVNFAGQVVYELDNIIGDSIAIETEGFAPGVYAVRIILSDSRSVVKRIVIGR